MNEQTRDAIHQNDATRARQCDRAEDLVAYLYGEATPAESASFSRHLDACVLCRDELDAFSNVRELVGAQRADALGAAPSLNMDELLAPVIIAAPPAPARARSAVAALRECFALSPLWLRAGVVAATILVCALAALTVARAEIRWDANGIAFHAGVRERVIEKRVETPAPDSFTTEQVEALVAERVKVERAAWLQELQRSGETVPVTARTSEKKPAPRVEADGGARRQPQRKRAAPGASRRNEQLLEEDDLPGLSDLLSGVYE
jgi:anti-sigma factor RsiW